MSKRKVILVYPNTREHDLDPQTPASVMTLAPGIQARGYEVVIVDTRVDPDWRDSILEHLGEAIYVGVSSMSGPQIHYAMLAAELVRTSDPSVPIVWGGMHATFFPEQTVVHPLVDIVVKGNADDSAGELAQCLVEGGDLGQVAGVYYVDDRGQVQAAPDRPLFDMKKVQIPDWDLVHVDRYTSVSVETARGCPFRCAFCYNVAVNEQRWRTKPEGMVIEEIAHLKKNYGISDITMLDDNFFSNQHRAARIADGLIDANLGVRWGTTCRAPYIANWDDAYVDRLKRSGVHVLFAGIESGSPRILEYIKKDCTVEDIENAARAAHKHQLRVTTTFILGFPNETYEDWMLTLGIVDRLKQLYPDIVLENIFAYTPYPGNHLYQDSIRSGWTPPKTLDEWSGGWVETELPWLDLRQRRLLKNLPYIYRFVFWSNEIKRRFVGERKWRAPAYKALRADALVRWRLRQFDYAPEFDLLKKLTNRVARTQGGAEAFEDAGSASLGARSIQNEFDIAGRDVKNAARVL